MSAAAGTAVHVSAAGRHESGEFTRVGFPTYQRIGLTNSRGRLDVDDHMSEQQQLRRGAEREATLLKSEAAGDRVEMPRRSDGEDSTVAVHLQPAPAEFPFWWFAVMPSKYYLSWIFGSCLGSIIIPVATARLFGNASRGHDEDVSLLAPCPPLLPLPQPS